MPAALATNAMYMDEERVELGDHHGKKKGKRQEGKSKGESGRRRDKEAMEIESAADIPENGEEEAVIGISKEKEGHMSKKEKGRRKEKDRINGSFDSGSTNHVVGKEEAKNLASSVHAEGDKSKDGVKKDKKNKEKKEKKKEKEAEMIGQKQTFTVQNLGSEYADRDKVGEKQSSTSKQATGSKKSKRKHMVSDQIVTREDKKRKKEHAVVLEESSEIRNTETGDNRESKKKRGKKIDKVSSDLCKNASAGGEEIDVDGTNHKEEKKGKEIAGGKREKEKEAHSKDKGKRVSFADATEVFTIEGGDDEEGGSSGDSKLVHGQRFTQEEDETLMEAIRNYAEMKQLGEKGLEMIRSCSKHPELKGCWNDIAKSVPHRPRMAIYSRAQILLYRSAERKWTEEEKGKIRWFVETNGTDWKKLADELGKSAIHVKDTWRRIKPKNLRKGTWTQEEQQNLFDLVHLDLRTKTRHKDNPTHRRLRENISWEAISDKLTTRNHKTCCLKWYNTLASPLVKQGIWADIDDYLLVEALQKDDAVCIEDVDWDSLLDHRSGEVCRQRWNQMVRSIGGHREKPFIEQVEVLSKRYCREMLDYRK